MEPVPPTFTERVRALWLRLPAAARKYLVDFTETAAGLIVALNFVVPGSLDEAKAQALLVGGAVVSAAISSFRRAWPSIRAWLVSVFVTTAMLLRP